MLTSIEIPIPTRTPLSTWGERISVAIKVLQVINPSEAELRIEKKSFFGWMRPITAATTTAPRVAFGRRSKILAKGKKRQTTIPVTKPDHLLWAPESLLREDLLNEPPTGNAPENAEATFANP